jgi:excisionase family DNA binding protein
MEQLLTIEDVAELLQMPPGFVEQQIRMNYLDIIKIGNEVRIEAPAFRRYIENRNAVTPLVGQQRLQAVE